MHPAQEYSEQRFSQLLAQNSTYLVQFIWDENKTEKMGGRKKLSTVSDLILFLLKLISTTLQEYQYVEYLL